ncbi:MAG TPA: hypothetical protein VK709_13430 [Candidatus Saccharimonadales bacterium]|jgi:hypothetical protein|nr:hypothetical protein [Candidatus Saccharimonadales bacterium]
MRYGYVSAFGGMTAMSKDAEPEAIYGPKRIWPERDAHQPVSPEELFG